ncbi:luciferase-like domain-containing protein [Leucosporidium creatinivorum]|uniref:Luciferase-like domain-containing protein n=1 Tax=Leucosporidium creatinivorum TaxID=106004 RepID=A0A1Y2G0E6_9BASI|nr:luciferase-like domain-containing protein [Leucosporidium creatinivorum]
MVAGVAPSSVPLIPTNGASSSSKGPFPKRKLILNAFDCIVPSHNVPGTWRGEKGEGHKRFDTLDYWIETAKLLEKGKFHGIFIADSYGFLDIYQGNLDASLRGGFQIPKLDPMLIAAVMASVTTNLALGLTQSTTYEPPFALARRFTTLDHISNGRAAWNIVTSVLPSAARNFGLKEAIEHDKRYEIADEYMDVVYKLWESSWHDDAVKRDAISGTWTDPTLVRPINHSSPHFPDIPGPFISHPSRQRTPALYQAGSSGAGTTFGAKHAEAVFIAQPTPKVAALKVAEYRKKVEEAGRDPRSLKVLPQLLVFLGKTEEEAEENYKYWHSYGDGEVALAFYAGFTGVDWAQWGPDEELTPEVGSAGHAFLENWKRMKPEIKVWTREVFKREITISRAGAVAIGTPAKVADIMEEWITVGDIDGFNLTHFARNESFEDIVNLLIPELQSRGLFHTDYDAVPQPTDASRPIGVTAREGLLGVVGHPHLDPSHHGHQFKWIS